MSAKSFYLVVVDDERGVFNVLGPMSDDRTETKAVVEMQEKGRRVRCFTSGGGTREQVIEECQHLHKWKLAAEHILDS